MKAALVINVHSPSSSKVQLSSGWGQRLAVWEWSPKKWYPGHDAGKVKASLLSGSCGGQAAFERQGFLDGWCVHRREWRERRACTGSTFRCEREPSLGSSSSEANLAEQPSGVPGVLVFSRPLTQEPAAGALFWLVDDYSTTSLQLPAENDRSKIKDLEQLLLHRVLKGLFLTCASRTQKPTRPDKYKSDLFADFHGS